MITELLKSIKPESVLVSCFCWASQPLFSLCVQNTLPCRGHPNHLYPRICHPHPCQLKVHTLGDWFTYHLQPRVGVDRGKTQEDFLGTESPYYHIKYV